MKINKPINEVLLKIAILISNPLKQFAMFQKLIYSILVKKFCHSRFQLLLFFLLIGFTCRSQSFLSVQNKDIVNKKGDKILFKGIGLGGWMLQEGYMLGVNEEGQQHKIREKMEALAGKQKTDQFYAAWLKNFIQKSDIDSMHSWGFNMVRLPMHYNLFTLPVDDEPVAGKNTWLKKGFQLTDSLIAWCKVNKMYVVLDLHAAPGGQGNDVNIADADTTKPTLWASTANQQKTIALWKEIARHYVNEPVVAAYDIINEPNFGFTDTVNDKHGLAEKINAPLKKLLIQITAAIREVDKKHIIIIEGNAWGNNYNGILPVWDNNMVLSFHKYWNYNTTKAIQNILDTRTKYNIPVWVGETGENSNVWFTQAIKLFNDNNIGWTWWPLKKMGNNNPLQIKSSVNYDSVLNFWNGKGLKPTAATAAMALIDLANNAKQQNNIYHKDVIDAMLRQPNSSAAIPFTNNSIKNRSVLYAVNYDMGVNGVAYFDNDTANYWIEGNRSIGNRGSVYRNDGVDISADKTAKNSFYVSDIENGEWLQFTIDVLKKGKYTLLLSTQSIKESGNISIEYNDKIIEKNIVIETGEDANNWKITSVKNIVLKAGKQTLKVYFVKGGFNFKSIQFIAEN